MARVINLKFEGTCKDCGASLPAGSKARYYGPGKIYGTECHPQKPKKSTRKGNSTYTRPAHEIEDKSRGPIRSNYDPHAVG